MVDPTVVERRHDELEPMFSLASLNKRLERPCIRDLNNNNSASSQNVPGLALLSSFPPRPFPINPSMRVRATLRRLTLEFSVRLPRIFNS